MTAKETVKPYLSKEPKKPKKSKAKFIILVFANLGKFYQFLCLIEKIWDKLKPFFKSLTDLIGNL
jgi:hypothetical protein